MSAGISVLSKTLPASSRQMSACIVTRSTTPWKSASLPIGIWIGTGRAPRRSRIMSTQRQKSAPVRSILLMKQMRGTLVPVRLAPDRLRLGLHAGDAVEDDHRAVEHPEAALDLDGEVHVPGRIDDVDSMVVPRRVVAAAVMVMPRSCSWTIQSMVAAPS